jgi:hypothetical protein
VFLAMPVSEVKQHLHWTGKMLKASERPDAG